MYRKARPGHRISSDAYRIHKHITNSVQYETHKLFDLLPKSSLPSIPPPR